MTRQELEAYIRQGAVDRGLDPDVAVSVWQQESSGSTDPNMRGPTLPSGHKYAGSYAVGPFGIMTFNNPPSTLQGQADWYLDYLKKRGVRGYYGETGANGVTGMPEQPTTDQYEQQVMNRAKGISPGAGAPGGSAINNQQGGSSMDAESESEYHRQQALRAALNAGQLPSAGDQLNTLMPGAGNPAPGGGNDLMFHPPNQFGAFDPHQAQQPQMPTLVQPQQAGFLANWLNNPINQFGARLQVAADPSGQSFGAQLGKATIDAQAAMQAQNATQLQAQMERLKLNAQMDQMQEHMLQTTKRREIASKLRKAGYGADADYLDMGGDFGKLIGIGGNGGVTVNVGPTKSQEYSQAGVFGAAGSAPAPEGAGTPPGNGPAPDGTGPAPGGSSGYQLDPDLRPMAQVDPEQAVKIQEARNKQRNNQEFSQQQQEQRQQDRVDIAKRKQEVAAATIDDGIKAVDDLLTLFDEHGTEGAGWFSDGNIQGQYDALRIQVLRAAADLQNAGVLQQGEYERINEQLPDPASFGSVFKKNDRIKSSYTTLRKLLERKRNSIAGDNGHAQFMPEASTAPMSDAYGGAYNPDTGEIE